MDRLSQAKSAYIFFFALAAFLPIGYYIKSLYEPINWWWLSQYYPAVTFTVNECLSIVLGVFFYTQSKRIEQRRLSGIE